MNILLLGYGKMGKTIERIAIERGHTIALIVDYGDEHLYDKIEKGSIDVAIEFTQPSAVVENIKRCFDKGIPIVSGTTGWLDKLEEIEAECRQKDGTFFYASNYSIGVNIFFKLNEYLSGIMNRYANYKVSMEEIHHTEKKDAPSGTAITLAQSIIDRNQAIGKWVNVESDKKEELGIVSKRIEKVPGTHTVVYKSNVDEIEIKHTAHSREGFALGAVMVAEWAKDKKGMLQMDDFLKI